MKNNKIDTKAQIERFLEINSEKKIVVVQGLGFVGAVMSLVVCNSDEDEYAVIGVDLESNKHVIESINSGVFPIEASDPKIKEYFENTTKKRNFLASYDPKVYQYADTIIVDINLDVQKESDFNRELQSFNIDLNPFRNAIRTIGENCKRKCPDFS